MTSTDSREQFLREAVKAGLRMQDRFEPVPTPDGEMKSAGVAPLQKIKASLRKRRPANPAAGPTPSPSTPA